MSKTLSADQTLNMVAVLKGDVNGSWGTSAAATSRVEYGDPTYFATLANNLRVAQDVWGIS
jgi:predicted fused transcriptional regulator/phosphomethylpyrimidine kinase